MNKCFKTLLAFSVLVTAYSCQSSESNSQVTPSETGSTDTATSAVTAQKLYDKLKNPWGLAWLPDGRLLVTERSGEILVFKNDQFTGEKLTGVPDVVAKGQGGLMDIKIHPDFANNNWIYITYSKPVTGGASTAVMRFQLQGNALTNKQDVFVAKPALDANFHFGSRVVFDNDGFMYVSVGERGTMEKVLQLDNDHGKIHRLHDDGRVPADNPFANQNGAHPTIWTYGHRNPQGMVYDAANNRLWAVEHGPKGGDELNLIEKGKNYGWPKASYGINYDGTELTKNKELEGVQNPVRYWVPSIAPCGMTQVTSDKYAGWKGNLLVGALAFQHIARVDLNNTQFKSEEKLLQDIGRVRAVEQSPDGFIYAVTEGPGQLVKLMPAK
jgi:glucose/arabinose dehydrogenase